jgi:hypothetical protein
MSAPVTVHFTVDVECRAEHRLRSGVEPACGYDERIWGRGTGEELGLRRLLAELEARGFRGTFFVEPIGAHSFGRAGLREVCGEIAGRGHDVQLHLHPSLRRARWLSEGQAPLSDDMADYDAAEQAALMREGLAMLEEAGVPRASLVAFRAGNFAADARTWAAMAEAGLSASSNYNPAYVTHGCRLRPSRPAPGAFASDEAGVLELPITCFTQGASGFRHLQIGAVSSAELADCLDQCRRLSIANVTLVMHPFELFFLDARRPARPRPNVVNVRRLRRVLDHLQAHPADFRVRTIAETVRERPAAEPVRPYPAGRAALRLARHAEQALKRLNRLVALPLPSGRPLAPGHA